VEPSDSAALDSLEGRLSHNYQTIWSLCYRLSGNADVADNLAQETCLRVVRHYSSFRGASEFRTWLYRITRNVSVAERLRVVDEYRAWAKRLAKDGQLVIADELGRDAGRMVATAAPQGTQDLDDPSSPHWLAGYFIITALDYDAALAVAQGYHHLKYGGTIEVREILQDNHT